MGLRNFIFAVFYGVAANWPPAPIINRWIPNRYDYQILYELDSTKLEGSLLAFDIEAPTFTHDIHIGFRKSVYYI